MSTLFKDQIVYATLGETIAVGDMLYMSQGTGADAARTAGRLYKLEVANPDRNVFYGIAKEAGNAADANKKVVTGGRFDGLAGLTPGLPIYADPAVAGGVTQVRPASNVQVIGVAIDADSFSVNGALAGSFGAGEGSGGVGGVDILFVQDFEAAALGDFTQTGLVLSSTNPLKGAVSANLVHQPAINQSFKQIIAVDEKFRGRNITLKLNIKSAASAGNVTLTVVDETNAVTLVSSEQLPVSNDVGGAIGQVSFDMPDDCLSFSYEVVALPEAGSPVTIVDDVIAEITSLIDEQSVLVQEADSNFQFNGFGVAYGATNTRILNLTGGTIVKNTGDAIQFSQSSTLGSTFTALKNGVYSFNISIDLNTTAVAIGLSKNSTQLSTPITDPSFISANRLITAVDSGIGQIAYINWTGELNQGDIVRVHGDGSALGTTGVYAQCSVSYQGSLKQLNPNPNSKITIPTSELRMEGASTRGSTATAIVRFDNIAKIRGDAFEVLSDAALGTRIVMKKAGKVDLGAALYRTGASQNCFLTLNQSVLTTTPSSILSEILQQAFTSGTDDVLNLNWSGFLKVGDVVRVSSSTNPTGNPANIFSVAFQEQDISVSVTNTLPQFSESDSSVRVDTANGYGSTGTRIRRFSNVRDNIGSDIEYVPSAVNGDSFVVKSAGIYAISYSEQINAGVNIGITKNATGAELATNVVTLGQSPSTTSLVLDSTGNVSAGTLSTSWQGYLQLGDVIRAHTDGATAADNENCRFTISKVGKPNVTGVDVTPFVNIPVNNPPETVVAKATASVATVANVPTVIPLTSLEDNKGSFVLQSNGVKIPKTAKYKVTINTQAFGNGEGVTLFLYVNGVLSKTGAAKIIDNNTAGSYSTLTDSFVVDLNVNDIASVYVGIGTSARNVRGTELILEQVTNLANDNIISPTESFSTDTASLVYAPSSLYTLATLSTAPVGTFITFTYAANTNTRTQTTTAPTQTTADMNVNGIRLFARAFNATSTAASPSTIAIQIGKGLKGKSLDLYKSIGKVTAGTLDLTLVTTTVEYGAWAKDYNELTGVLFIDAGCVLSGSNTAHSFIYSDTTAQADGYLVINASKSPVLTSVPLLQVRTAVLSDVKANGSTGGTATSGAYQTRTLNTIDDPTGIVTSLTSNQFTLPSGEYYIEAFAPAYAVGANKFKLRNVTDSTDAIIGPSNYAAVVGAGDRSSSSSELKGTIIISSSKTFELQHRVTNTSATQGFGVPSSFGDSEVYSKVKIQKIK